MAIRNDYLPEDIQMCFYKLFVGLQGSQPWSRWDVLPAYPEADRFTDFDKPFLYVDSPTFLGAVDAQGSQLPMRRWQLYVGCWSDNKVGRTGELNIMTGRVLNLMLDPYTVHSTTFNVDIGADSFSNTTLIAQGIEVETVVTDRDGFTGDVKQFRREIGIHVLT
jgi:hypothetical protein